MKINGYNYLIQGNTLRYWKGCACSSKTHELTKRSPLGQIQEVEAFLNNL